MRKINKHSMLNFVAMEEYLKDKTVDDSEKQSGKDKQVLFFLFVPRKKTKAEVN